MVDQITVPGDNLQVCDAENLEILLRLSRSALPWHRLLDIDARLVHGAARPVIIPETIIVDQG